MKRVVDLTRQQPVIKVRLLDGSEYEESILRKAIIPFQRAWKKSRRKRPLPEPPEPHKVKRRRCNFQHMEENTWYEAEWAALKDLEAVCVKNGEFIIRRDCEDQQEFVYTGSLGRLTKLKKGKGFSCFPCNMGLRLVVYTTIKQD